MCLIVMLMLALAVQPCHSARLDVSSDAMYHQNPTWLSDRSVTQMNYVVCSAFIFSVIRDLDDVVIDCLETTISSMLRELVKVPQMTNQINCASGARGAPFHLIVCIFCQQSPCIVDKTQKLTMKNLRTSFQPCLV